MALGLRMQLRLVAGPRTLTIGRTFSLHFCTSDARVRNMRVPSMYHQGRDPTDHSEERRGLSAVRSLELRQMIVQVRTRWSDWIATGPEGPGRRAGNEPISSVHMPQTPFCVN